MGSLVYYALSALVFIGLALFLAFARGQKPRPWTNEPAGETRILAMQPHQVAMCYAAMPSDTQPVEYVCPLCGNKTQWSDPQAEQLIATLPEYERLAETCAPKLTIEVRAADLCRHCRPNAEQPSIAISVVEMTAQGTGRPHTTLGVTLEDMRLLCEFCTGPLGHAPGWGGTDALGGYGAGELGSDTSPLASRERLSRLLGREVTAEEAAFGAEGTRASVRERLRELATAPAPTDLFMGAMCYKPGARPQSAEYVCPRCGEKTVYTTEQATVVLWELPAMRRLVTQVPNLTVTLDESEFCRHCSPNTTDPRTAIVVRFTGDWTGHVTEGVSTDDLELLKDFMSGSDKHIGSQGRQTPLKDHLDRLEQLLGEQPTAGALSREQIAARLRELAASPSPTELAMGAMCYGPPGPIGSADYVCPKCGDRTTWTDPGATWALTSTVTAARRYVAEIPDRGVELDESAFCKHCRPDVTEPGIALVVHIDGEAEARRDENVSPDDVRLVVEFLQGSLIHKGSNDGESPLKDHIDRIEELLGVTP